MLPRKKSRRRKSRTGAEQPARLNSFAKTRARLAPSVIRPERRGDATYWYELRGENKGTISAARPQEIELAALIRDVDCRNLLFASPV